MTVHGLKITPEQERAKNRLRRLHREWGRYITPPQEMACLNRMLWGEFTQRVIAGVLRYSKNKKIITKRISNAASRLIQRERKAGRIRWDGRCWWPLEK